MNSMKPIYIREDKKKDDTSLAQTAQFSYT